MNRPFPGDPGILKRLDDFSWGNPLVAEVDAIRRHAQFRIRSVDLDDATLRHAAAAIDEEHVDGSAGDDAHERIPAPDLQGHGHDAREVRPWRSPG